MELQTRLIMIFWSLCNTIISHTCFFLYEKAKEGKSACYESGAADIFYETCILSGMDYIFKTKVSQAPIILKHY